MINTEGNEDKVLLSRLAQYFGGPVPFHSVLLGFRSMERSSLFFLPVNNEGQIKLPPLHPVYYLPGLKVSLDRQFRRLKF